MSKFGMIGASYTAQSKAVADEETINLYPETIESAAAQTRRSFFSTPGLEVFTTADEGPTRAQCWTGSQYFAVIGPTLYEIATDGTKTARGTIQSDGYSASIAASNVQLLIVGGSKAYCYNLDTQVLAEVTSLLAGIPIQCEYSDGYFIVIFKDSNKFQISDILDGTTWPGIQVNGVSVFPENIVSIIVSHRELWVFGSQHAQPYQDTGSDEVFDVIPGALVDMGSSATFGRTLLDNTVFWISEDQRGARQTWRANGYTPLRISTHAVETSLSSYSSEQIAGVVSYSYQDNGHLFWVLYIPGTDCTWVFDVAEGLWHKRQSWDIATATPGPHRSWNHVYAFGKHLVGDWKTGNIYEMKLPYDTGGGNYVFVTDSGDLIRRIRRTPTLVTEMEFIYGKQITLDFATGLGPQPPLIDGNGDPRPPQVTIRWSNDRGFTWGNDHTLDCGYSGEYTTRVVQRRLGRWRYRVFEVVMTDPIPWVLVDAYLETE